MELSERFWDAGVEELIRGYVDDESEDAFICLVCGERCVKGMVYADNGAFYEAEKYIRVHIAAAHGSMFDYLVNLNKKVTGLTDLQKQLLAFFRDGVSDADIVKELDGGSTSTIRHHRFTLREKGKQAKVFLAILALADSKPRTDKESFVPVHRTATAIDERFATTGKEKEDILRRYFPEGPDGPLKEFPKKEKRKIVILTQLIKRFDTKKTYTEKEVNAVLKEAFGDFVTLRRYMIEYGYMDRKDDGSAYWVKQ